MTEQDIKNLSITAGIESIRQNFAQYEHEKILAKAYDTRAKREIKRFMNSKTRFVYRLEKMRGNLKDGNNYDGFREELQKVIVFMVYLEGSYRDKYSYIKENDFSRYFAHPAYYQGLKSRVHKFWFDEEAKSNAGILLSVIGAVGAFLAIYEVLFAGD